LHREKYKNIGTIEIMPILQTWTVERQPGTKPILFSDWLLTLPAEEQQRYYTARIRADALRQAAIDEGRMIITDDGYVWKDQSAFKIGKEHDDECMDFYTRYNAEIGIVQTGTHKEIP
jgi:hypothetical protein